MSGVELVTIGTESAQVTVNRASGSGLQALQSLLTFSTVLAAGVPGWRACGHPVSKRPPHSGPACLPGSKTSQAGGFGGLPQLSHVLPALNLSLHPVQPCLQLIIVHCNEAPYCLYVSPFTCILQHRWSLDVAVLSHLNGAALCLHGMFCSRLYPSWPLKHFTSHLYS